MSDHVERAEKSRYNRLLESDKTPPAPEITQARRTNQQPAGDSKTMSKRTTPASQPTSDSPAPRRRSTKAVETTPANAPKASRARRKVTTVNVTADEVTRTAGSGQPSHDEIAIRAYFIALERGADPVAAWLLAERELTTA